MDKRNRLHLNPKALSDIEKIFDFSFQKWGFDQAEKYQEELNDGMNKILNHPVIGRPFIFRSHNYRIITVKSHIIFYRLSEDQIFITRILHQSMDYKKYL